MENNITAEKKAELLAAIDKAQSALEHFEELDAQMTTRNAPTIEAALNDLENAVKIVDDFIKRTHEDTDLLIAFHLLKVGTPPTPEEADAFLEKLTPSKVKSLLPLHEVTPQEAAALTFTKEERAARRSGSPKEAQAATNARRNRAKAFLATLNLSETITLLTKGTSGGHYSTFTPTPAAENEDYSIMSTTQFSTITGGIISLADMEEAAKQLNRRKKRKIASAATANKGTLSVIDVKERGGAFRLAIPAENNLANIRENGEKELDYLIGQIYRRAYDTHAERLKATKITITDKELAAAKVCGTDNVQVNRRNFIEFETFLYNCSAVILTTSYKKKKKGEEEPTIEKVALQRLITEEALDLHGGIHEIVLNPRFNWKGALKYYTPLPKTAPQLTSRSYRTLKLILQKARLNAADRTNAAEISLQIAEIADLLRLPIKSNKIKRDVKDVIAGIIDEINRLIMDVALTLEADADAPIKEYLAGSMKATFTGELLKHYEDLHAGKEKGVKKQIAKHNRAVNAQKQREANAAAKAKADAAKK